MPAKRSPNGDAPAPAPLTFEQKRQLNIEKHQKIMAAIDALKPKAKRAPRSQPAKKKVVVAAEPLLPTRKSSRLAGLAPEAGLKRKRADGHETEDPEAKLRKPRMDKDLSFGDIVVEGKKWENGLGGLKGLIHGAQPGIRTFTEEDIKETTDKGLKDLSKRLNRLKLYEHWVPNQIKITPQRVYALGFHPIQDKAVVFAGDKEGAIGIFDASQTPPEVDDEDEDVKASEPVIAAFKTHTRSVTSFIFSPIDHNSVFTSSYDSSIRRMDLEKQTSVQVWAPKDPDAEMAISCLDMADSEPNVIYFSTLQGTVGRHDVRTSDEPEIWTLSSAKIGGFSLHPLQPHLLATASLDRTLKIWDARNMTKVDGFNTPTLLGEDLGRLSVSHASWSAGGYVATTSYDDTIKIYNFSDAATWKPSKSLGDTGNGPASMKAQTTVRHNNQSGRWVSIIKPHWQKRPNDGIEKFTIANMNRFVDIYASNGTQLAQLGDENVSAVPAVAHFHPTMDWVAGGTASGKLCLWQ